MTDLSLTVVQELAATVEVHANVTDFVVVEQLGNTIVVQEVGSPELVEIQALGPQGPSGTVTIGNVTTGAPGSAATVTNSGSSTAAVLDIQIPRGDTGDVTPQLMAAKEAAQTAAAAAAASQQAAAASQTAASGSSTIASTKASEAANSAATASAAATSAATSASTAQAGATTASGAATTATTQANTATTKAAEAATSATNAAASATTATTKAAEAATSATTATSKAAEATTKAAEAAASASSASTSAAAAATSASAASASATSAQSAATTATNAASTSSTKAGEAAASAATASTKAAEAATSSATATTKATEAASSATTASGAASTATTAAAAASSAATTATTQAAQATTQAAQATASSTSAASSATTATNKAAEATTRATEAASSAATATGAASNASTSATDAAASATSAATQASAASTSAQTATTKATEAASSAAAAATSSASAGTSATAAANSATTASTQAGVATTKAAEAAASATSAAASAAAATAGGVRYDTAQSLSAGEKDQARSNMGLATVAASGAYADLSGLPTALSAFGNDVGYLTAALAAATYLAASGGALTGDLTFSGTGRRILGDFSNASVANRTFFQTTTPNSATQVGVLPNGSAVNAQLHVFGSSDPTNAPYGALVINSTSVRLMSAALGSASAMPMTFFIGTSEAGRISTNLNWLIGSSADDGSHKLQVTGSVKATGGFVGDLTGNVSGSAGSVSWSNVTGRPTAVSSFTNDAGYLTGITSSDVTGALGFTPYNSSNPAGYITGSGNAATASSASQLGTDTGSKANALQYWQLSGNSSLNPSDSWYYGLRMSHGDAESYYSATIALDFHSDSLLFRRKTGGNNQSWRTVLHDGNYSSYALPLSGGSLNGYLTVLGGGYIDSYGGFYSRDNLWMLNAAGNNWVTVIARNGGNPYLTNLTYEGSTILHSGNYSNYALPLSGGTINGNNGLWLSGASSMLWLGTSGGTNYVESGNSGFTGNAPLLFTGYNSAQGSTFTVNFATANFLGALQQGGNQVLHAGNYTSYSPSLAGSGASGTWGISVTGGAGKLTRFDVPAYNWNGSSLQNYWTKIGRVSGDCAMMVSIWTSTDSNYPEATKAIATFKSFSGGAISAQLDAVTANSCDVRIAIDNNGDCWIYSGAVWGSFLRYNVEEQYNCTIYTSPASQVGQPSGSLALRPGQSVRTTYGNVTAVSPSYTTFSAGNINAAGALTQAGNQVLHAGNYSGYALPLSGGTLSGALNMGNNGVNYANQFHLNNGFAITQGASSYGQFSNWVHLPGYHGLYSGQNNAHFYPNDGTYGAWKVIGTRNSWSGLEFVANNGNVSLMVTPGSNTTGFHNNSYGWQFRWDNGTLFCSKNSYGGGADSVVLDASNFSNYTVSRGGDTTWGTFYFGSNKGYFSYLGSQNTYGLEAFSSDGGAAAMSFHRGGYYAVNMGLDPDNVLRIGGWSAAANRWQLDMEGNNLLAGNLGLGGASTSFFNTYSNRYGVRLGSSGMVASTPGGSTVLSYNTYYATGAGMVLMTDGSAGDYVIGSDGGHYWTVYAGGTAGSITNRVGDAMLDGSGNFCHLKYTANDTTYTGFVSYAGYYAGTVTATMNQSGSQNTYHLYNKSGTNNGYRFYVSVNGGIYNYQGNDSNLSDARTKTDIAPAGDFLQKLCAIPVRSFRYKDQGDDAPTIGVIAQEVELVAPEFVNVEGFGELPDDGVPLKSIYTSDMQFAMLRAIQEQQVMIDALRAEIASIKSQLH